MQQFLYENREWMSYIALTIALFGVTVVIMATVYYVRYVWRETRKEKNSYRFILSREIPLAGIMIERAGNDALPDEDVLAVLKKAFQDAWVKDGNFIVRDQQTISTLSPITARKMIALALKVRRLENEADHPSALHGSHRVRTERTGSQGGARSVESSSGGAGKPSPR